MIIMVKPLIFKEMKFLSVLYTFYHKITAYIIRNRDLVFVRVGRGDARMESVAGNVVLEECNPFFKSDKIQVFHSL